MIDVHLTAQVQLRPSPPQAVALEATIRRANEACTWLAAKAWESKTFHQFALHKLAYREARAAFPDLSSQMIIRCNAKVADAYKIDRKRQPTFRKVGAIKYDSHVVSWKGDTVNVWALGGRMRMPFVCGEHQRELLAHRADSADLVLRDGKFYLFVAVDVPDTEERVVLDWLGVDVGVANIATTSDGENFSGGHLNGLRRRSAKLRGRLQKKGTKSAKRLLKARRRKEHRFSQHVNHVISKQIVVTAERTGRGIAVENLDGIHARIRARRSQRRILNCWAFADLQSKIAYKARRVGIPVCYVDPRNTSRECRVCGHIEKANRKTRELFACRACGHTADADVNAAAIIASRAPIVAPYADSVDPGQHRGAELQGCS